MAASKTTRVFLSYAPADRDAARATANELRKQGLLVWDPEIELLPGDDWAVGLQKGLDQADAMVLFVSLDAFKSPTVTREFEYALVSERLGGRLIPVIVKATRSAPWILKSMPEVHHKSPESTAQQIADMLRQPAYVPQKRQRAG
jgi:hypothetical protein